MRLVHAVLERPGVDRKNFVGNGRRDRCTPGPGGVELSNQVSRNREYLLCLRAGSCRAPTKRLEILWGRFSPPRRRKTLSVEIELGDYLHRQRTTRGR